MEKPQKPTTEKQPKLGITDFAALYQMSMRSFFWKIDGRQGMKTLGKQSGDSALLTAFYFIALIIAYGPLFLIIGGIAMLKFYMVPVGLLYLVLLSPVVFNLSRLKYNLTYTKSAWWQNTGIRPSQVKKDRGLYGEYIATMAAEQCLANNNLFGKVFNSVIVPKKDGDFNEIDLISVNECGIHVIEAKARGGAFYGSLVGDTWKQEIGGQSFELQNPVLQNQNHINYLQEYLMEALPEGSARLKATFPLNAVNVVLFAQVEMEDHLNRERGPKEAFFGMAEGKGGYQHCNLRQIYKERFTKEEVGSIIAALEKISGYSQQQLEQKKQQRAEQNRRGDFRHPVSFYPVELESPTLNGEMEVNLFLCREAGGYRTYQDPEDSLFKAIPAGHILAQGTPCRTLEEAQNQAGTGAELKAPSQKLPRQPKQQTAEPVKPEPAAPVAPVMPAPPAEPVPAAVQQPAAPEPAAIPVRTSGQARPTGQAQRGGQATPAGQAKRKG